MRKKWLLLLTVAVIACFAGLGIENIRAWLLSKGESKETRGWRVAQEKGCFQCHGEQGRGAVGNPGGEEIPAWQDFSFMMSMKDESELRAWILDGAPKRLLASESFLEERRTRLLKMPAYRGHLSEQELDALLDFYKGVSGLVWPKEEKAEKGFLLAKEQGCFHCHGYGGRLDMPNPGSLVGTIPAWNGPNFTELAKDEREIREWIMTGGLKRLQEHWLAKRFLERQVLAMPAYEELLSEDEVEAILAYIRWLRDEKAPGHEVSFEYEQ